MLQLYQSGMLDLTQPTREALYSAFADPGGLLRVWSQTGSRPARYASGTEGVYVQQAQPRQAATLA